MPATTPNRGTRLWWTCLLVIAAWCALPTLPARAADAPAGLDNTACLACHDGHKKLTVATKEGSRDLAPVSAAALAKGVHAKMQCVQCHTDIVDAQAAHKKAAGVASPDCASCHTALWERAKQAGAGAHTSRLEIVALNIAAYQQSFHARPDADDPSKVKATCADCHGSHDFAVPMAGTPERDAWRMTIPESCGKCHEEQLEDYQDSVHGKLVLGQSDPKGAVCTDCHTTHEITGSSAEVFKLKNVLSCGGCHKEELESYRDTYHGQVNKLGYTYTAKCADCHGSHGIVKVSDPASKVHPDNRLKTCATCHNAKKPGMVPATAGFVSFGPHANTHDFAKYPQMWIASKSMIALLIGVFAFFWLHSGLWYYREWQDRKAGATRVHVKTAALGDAPEKHFRRFHWGWRLAHLVFAIVTMTLVLTGTTAMYADSAWAPIVAKALGGPKVLGLIHRVAAALFVGIFMVHFVYVMAKLLRSKTFRWFGPDSLIPNWKDFTDCWAMFKWFVGRGPRPHFDRWAYFEKFDYWAVFWGVNIIGWSGLMLAFPHVTATYLPGWVFNVGTLVHGEEAFLAAVFLFTVHFFNNHFRPDKLPPPDIVMFTGTLSLDEFKRDHPAQYERLVTAGELEQYLVDQPSRPMRISSIVLGLVLITIGFTLLALVGIGFFAD